MSFDNVRTDCTDCQVLERAGWLLRHSQEQASSMPSGLGLGVILMVFMEKEPKDKGNEHLKLWGGS